MQRYSQYILDQYGNVITGATVTVTFAGTGTPITPYSDNGVTTKSNPFTMESDGEVTFYAANGRYDIQLTGTVVKDIDDVILFDRDDESVLFEPSDFKILTLPSAQSFANNTLTLVSGLTFDVLAGQWWIIESQLNWTNTTTAADISAGFGSGTTSDADGFFRVEHTCADASLVQDTIRDSLGIDKTISVNGEDAVTRINGMLIVSADSTVGPLASQRVTVGGSPVDVRRGSFVKAWRVV